jgi:multiple sugar transport system ATP-binding protein
LALYDKPVNLFVAGFIGSPAMNLLEATLTEAGAEVLGHVMEVPLTAEDRRRHHGPVTIGMRPEDLRISPDGQGLPITVSVVEELGADAYVYGMAGDGAGGNGEPITARTDLIIRIETRRSIERGSIIHVTASPEDIRVFATESGERLDSAR